MQANQQENILIGAEVGKEINCSLCKALGTTDEFITAHNNKGLTIYLCASCKSETNKVFEAETFKPNFVRGIAAGLIGAIIGGGIWYLIAVLTRWQIGYVSLGVGYLIGYAVHFGSGKKRGVGLQVISALIMVVTIIFTEKFIFDYFANQYIQAHLTDFPDFTAGQRISVALTDPMFIKQFFSPIRVLIYAIGVYIAFKFCRKRNL